MSPKSKDKSRHYPTQTRFGPEFDELFEKIAKDAAGKPLSESLKPDSGSMVAEAIGRIVEIAMQQEMTAHLGYEPHERLDPGQQGNDEPTRRLNTRNGTSKKTLKTSHGQTEINVPRDRDASFDPVILPKRSSVTQELEDRVIALYTSGLSTRDIQEHLVELYGVEASSDFISNLTRKLDEELTAWRNRPLNAVYPILYVDCIHIKVRHSHGVRSTAVYQLCGYNESGQLEVLGLYMAPEGETAESARFWHKCMIDLENRGVRDVLILCADGLEGLEKAAKAVWEEVQFSPCVVHLIRNSTKFVHHSDRKPLCKDLKTIYGATSYEVAELKLMEFKEQWNDKYPRIVEKWEGYLPRLKHLWEYGAAIRKLVYTTNPIENVRNQQRKVLKTKRSLPNIESCLRLMTLLARKITTKNLKRGRRLDWRKIVAGLHIHFEGRIPARWGLDQL